MLVSTDETEREIRLRGSDVHVPHPIGRDAQSPDLDDLMRELVRATREVSRL